MKSPLETDLHRLQTQAFDRASDAETVLRRYHHASANFTPADAPAMSKLHDWILVPYSLWPFNVQDVLVTCLELVEQGKRLSKHHRLIAELLPTPPAEPICAAVAEHEHFVATGSYENLIQTQAKYQQNELATKTAPELSRQWEQIKAAFTVGDYCDHKGVIRRSMTVERNLHRSFSVNLHRPAESFQAAFDAFCLRWNLLGMLHDEPLPLKLTVTMSAYVTSIHIPAYWSFDPKRDIRWDAITRLHRVRVAGRQGAAIAENKAQRMRDAAKLRQLDQEVLRLRLKGEAKHQHLCTGLGWDSRTSPKRISRLRAEFKGQTLA